MILRSRKLNAKKLPQPNSPRYLPEVLQAIYDLKEVGGSNSTKILSHVRSNLDDAKSRNLSTQVQRALRHATTSGIVKQRAGKFRINMEIVDPYKDCAECRRRERRKRQRRRRHRRRYGRQHSITSRSDSEPHRRRRKYGTPDSEEFPLHEVRRHRRRERSMRRRRRRRRTQEDALSDENKPDDAAKDIVYPDDHRDGDGEAHCDRQCDNPDCLCNVKEEIEEIPNSSDPPL